MKLIALSLIVSAFANAKAYSIKVTAKGFEPSTVSITKNESVQLEVTRTTDKTCATEIVVPDLKIKKTLPLNEVVKIDLGKIKSGKIKFGCGMGMMESGVIVVK